MSKPVTLAGRRKNGDLDDIVPRQLFAEPVVEGENL